MRSIGRGGARRLCLAGNSSMDAKTNLKSRLPSRHATEGPERAPHRAFYYAMGLTREQIHQPFVGVATCWNEAAPCNIALMRQAQAVKLGVAAGGATPREFCTITVTDGIAMGHAGMKSSLPSREVIADSIELTVRGHSYDALVGLAGCDKSQPGMMMAMCRLNVPSIFIYGGSILPGTFKGRPVTIQDVYEAVGKHSIGAMSDADQGIVGMAAHRQFDGIGDHLARRQRGLHPLVPHGDAVGHRYGAEFTRRAAAGGDPLLDRLGLAHQRDVAGSCLIPTGRDPDKRLMDLLARQPHGIIEGAVRRPLRSLGGVAAWQPRFQVCLRVHRTRTGSIKEPLAHFIRCGPGIRP